MVQFLRPRDVILHVDHRPGTVEVRPIVFANSLGTDLRIWDAVRDRLDGDIPTLALDKRGHGLSGHGVSDIPALSADMVDAMDYLGVADAVICGVSVGGMIAQGLAAARPDLVAGLVLCNTGARIGMAEAWDARIAAVREAGIEGIADAVLARWFGPAWSEADPVALAGWRHMLVRTPAEGYTRVCAAIRDADLTGAAATLRVPTLCVAGSADGATPPALVEALSKLIPGARYDCLDSVGHLPCIEAADRLTDMLSDFHRSLA